MGLDSVLFSARRPGKLGLHGLFPGLGAVQGKAQPEDLVRQRPNPVRLFAQPSQRRAQLNVLVVLSAYGLLVPLRRLLLTGQPLAQTGDLPVQPGHLLAHLTAFRAQGLDRGLLVLPPAPGSHASRRVSLSAFVIGPRLVGSTLASESRFSRRVTSACRERAFFAVRRTSFVSSTAAFSLLRHRSSCHFSEPARPRASTSAQRSSSARASAASAREHSRSARACACSYRDRQSRASRPGAGPEGDQIASFPSVSARSAPKSSSRLAMRGN